MALSLWAPLTSVRPLFSLSLPPSPPPSLLPFHQTQHREYHNTVYGHGQPEGWNTLDSTKEQTGDGSWWKCTLLYWATPEECANDETGTFEAARKQNVFFEITMAPIAWNIGSLIIICIALANNSYAYFQGCGGWK